MQKTELLVPNLSCANPQATPDPLIRPHPGMLLPESRLPRPSAEGIMHHTGTRVLCYLRAGQGLRPAHADPHGPGK